MEAAPGLRDGAGVIGRIVEHLDLEAAPRIVERRRGIDESLGDEALVVHRELDRDRREHVLGETVDRFRKLTTVAEVVAQKGRPVTPVEGENPQSH